VPRSSERMGEPNRWEPGPTPIPASASWTQTDERMREERSHGPSLRRATPRWRKKVCAIRKLSSIDLAPRRNNRQKPTRLRPWQRATSIWQPHRSTAWRKHSTSGRRTQPAGAGARVWRRTSHQRRYAEVPGQRLDFNQALSQATQATAQNPAARPATQSGAPVGPQAAAPAPVLAIPEPTQAA